MAYDSELAERVRESLADEPDVTEMAMFGGLAFLVGGTMAVAVSGRGGLMLRVDPEERDPLLEDPLVSPMVMRDREMAGWLLVDLDAGADDALLDGWVARGVERARTA